MTHSFNGPDRTRALCLDCGEPIDHDNHATMLRELGQLIDEAGLTVTLDDIPVAGPGATDIARARAFIERSKTRDKNLVRAGWDAAVDACILSEDHGSNARNVKKHEYSDAIFDKIVKETT
jgi:hypothetical protein